MEIWKDIKGYEGLYQISSFGNVKSLSREIIKGKRKYLTKEIFLRPGRNATGCYLYVNLYKNKKRNTYRIHILVSIAFLNHTPNGRKIVVNHKNFIRTDNRVENLEVITMRENTNQKHLKSSSKYTGVAWYKRYNKWRVQIYIKDKRKTLGYFIDEYEAHLVYEKKLAEIKSNGIY